MKPCPNCGSEGKEQWRDVAGHSVCDACWTDYVSQPYSRIVDVPKRSMDNPVSPKASGSPSVRPNPGSDSPQSPRNLKASAGRLGRFRYNGVHQRRRSDPLARGWAKVQAHSINTLCLICGRIFYHVKLDRCRKCLGLCQYKTDEEMGLGGKWQGRNERSVL